MAGETYWGISSPISTSRDAMANRERARKQPDELVKPPSQIKAETVLRIGQLSDTSAGVVVRMSDGRLALIDPPSIKHITEEELGSLVNADTAAEV